MSLGYVEISFPGYDLEAETDETLKAEIIERSKQSLMRLAEMQNADVIWDTFAIGGNTISADISIRKPRFWNSRRRLDLLLYGAYFTFFLAGGIMNSDNLWVAYGIGLPIIALGFWLLTWPRTLMKEALHD